MKNLIINKIYRILLIALLTFSIGISSWQKHEKPSTNTNIPTLEEAKQFFTEASSIVANSNFSAIAVGNRGKQLGVILNSTPFSSKYYGYAGPVPVLIAVSPDCKISGIELLPNDETAEYVDAIKNQFLNNWIGLTCTEASKIEVDGISGATMSSMAIANGIQSTLAYTFENKKIIEVSKFSQTVNIILFTLVIVFALLLFFVKILRKYRVILLFSSGIILGFLLKISLSLAMFQGIIKNGFNFSTGSIPLILLFISILLPIVTNRKFFCNYVCPYGALQELAGKYSPFKLRTLTWLKKSELNFRIIMLCAIIVLVISEINFNTALTEPFAAFSLLAAPIAVLILASIFLILSLFINKPWCNYLCPTGQLLDLMIVKKIDNTNKITFSTTRFIILLFAILIAILSYKNATSSHPEKQEMAEKPLFKTDTTSTKVSMGSKIVAYPMPVLLIGSYDSVGRPNIMTCAWAGIANSKPPMISISLRKATYTHGSIIKNKAFTVCIPTQDLVAQVDYAGLFSGRNENKFESLQLTSIKSEKVNAPYINECPIVFECILDRSTDLGSHTQFIGQIVDVKIDENLVLPNKTIDIENLKSLFFAFDGYYGLGEYLGKPFHIGKTLKAK